MGEIWGGSELYYWVDSYTYTYSKYIDEKSKVISKKVNSLLKPERIVFYLKLTTTIIVLLSSTLPPIIVFSITSTSLSFIIPDYLESDIKLSNIIAFILAFFIFVGMLEMSSNILLYISNYNEIKREYPEYLKEYKGWSKIKRIINFRTRQLF